MRLGTVPWSQSLVSLKFYSFSENKFDIPDGM